MKLGVCYVCPVLDWLRYEPLARRFASSYASFPAECPHEFHIICNGGNPNADVMNLFSENKPAYHFHDNTGWDIGAFASMTSANCDLMLFLGANTHFKRAGWLRRLMEAHEKFGSGLYGTSASFDICPHIRTNGFLCHPKLVADAWAKNSGDKKSRHHFELGKTSLTATAAGQNLPTILVTWDGFYRQDEWRKAPDIFRRGDQSNSLIYDRHHEIYESSSPTQKIRLGKIADGNKFEYYRAAIETRIGQLFKSRR